MAGRITELPALTGVAAAPNDLIEVLDVSDTTMAPTGTNKQMTLEGLGDGARPFYGGVRSPFNQGYGGGLPNRQLWWGQSTSWTVGWTFGFPFFVASGEIARFSAWRVMCEVGQAGARLLLAVYSVPSLLDGQTGTKVAGTEVDIDCSTAASKTATLAAPVTLPPGGYWMLHLNHGSASPPTFWSLYTDSGFHGSNVQLGNGAPANGPVIVAFPGQTSLAASQYISVNSGGGSINTAIATMAL